MSRNDPADLVAGAGRVLSAAWGPTKVELLDPIRTGWGRHDVIVCNTSGPADAPATVVVKAPATATSTLFDEWSNHEWLHHAVDTPGAVVPFHGGDVEVPLIVIGDAGAGPSLARLLQTPGAAVDAVVQERTLTARVHAMTRGREEDLAAHRRTLPAGPSPSLPMSEPDAVLAELGRWGVDLPADVVGEIRTAVARLTTEPGFRSLTFNDACPVNRIATSSGVVAIDLEHAAFGHPAIDAAWPAVGHLGCSTRIRPDEAIVWPLDARLSAESAYRGAVVDGFPEWAGDRFLDDLAGASVAWAATILSRHRDRTQPENRRSPARTVARSRIVMVLRAVRAVADRVDGLDATARWTRRVEERCGERWGPVGPLPEVAGLRPV